VDDLPNSDRADFASDQWYWLDYYTQPPSEWDGAGGGEDDRNQDREGNTDSRQDAESWSAKRAYQGRS
jgi:hypothetical protein